MRQQEDQIYALQDYLSEYQQLLCDARSENAQLKRQMVQGQFRKGGASGTADGTNALPSPPTAAPTQPPGTREPDVAPTVVPPAVPPLDLSTPAAPPLKDQSAIDPEQIAHEVLPAAAEIEVVDKPPAAVVLRGEVQLDDEASGPRVLVDVEPVAASGEPTQYRGRLSLLVLDPAAREKEQQLARWDFQPAELAPMVKPDSGGKSFEFPLQLPADAPTNRPLELWVRLLPADGEKLLGRTTLDLSRAGQFASAEVEPIRQLRPPVQAVAAELPIESSRRDAFPKMDSDVHTTAWLTARPGDQPKRRSASRSKSEWKLATQPVPEVESVPLAESRAVPALSHQNAGDDRYGVAARPEWSPDRPDGEAIEPTSEPTWSPTR